MKNAQLSATLFISLLFSILLVPAVSSDEAVHTDNIVIILDASGSMSHRFSSDPTKTKMEAAKEALRAVLAKIPDGVNIGVLVFGASNVRDDWVYPLGSKNDAKLIEAINLPRPNGGTPLGQYIKIGADRLLEQREKQYNYGSYRLLVVTDGEAGDPKKVKAYTPEVIDRQIRIDVIGVDMKQEHMLATVVDSYRRADNPGQLVKAVTEILAETSDTGVDAGGEDVFESIAPLTEEVAFALITAITKVPGNALIGEQPVAPAPEATTTQPTSGAGQGVIDTPPPTKKPWGLLVFIVIGILVLVGIRQLRRRGRES